MLLTTGTSAAAAAAAAAGDVDDDDDCVHRNQSGATLAQLGQGTPSTRKRRELCGV